MTDRELLEAAAKAAGFYHYEYRPGIGLRRYFEDQGFVGPGWNPLTDDGDALRLAVKLGMHIFALGNCVQAGPRGALETVAYLETDPLAATRRAIVRAAAAIGGALGDA